MGWWKITYWKEDSDGNDVKLTEEDLIHISKLVKEGYVEGEIANESA